MRTLIRQKDSFDSANTFEVLTTKGKVKASLHQDYDKVNDGIFWAMNSGTTLKDKYSEADRAEGARLAQEEPLKHGDTVEIEGGVYRVKVLGAYSDCAIFEPV